MGMYVVRCRNKIHTNESIEGTEGHAIEKWNEWCESIEKKRASFNEKDDFWFLRLRADVLKCCGNPDNLEIVKNPNGTSLATCKKCGRRHHVMHSEPGIFGFN